MGLEAEARRYEGMKAGTALGNGDEGLGLGILYYNIIIYTNTIILYYIYNDSRLWLKALAQGIGSSTDLSNVTDLFQV